MDSPEWLVVSLNLIVIAVAYLAIYPRFVGSDLRRLVQNDLVASLVALSVVGSLYWGSDQRFDLFVFTLNWFWFTILSFALLESPFALWYMRRYRILDRRDGRD